MALSVSLINIVCIIYLQNFLWRVFTYENGSHIDFQKQKEILGIPLEYQNGCNFFCFFCLLAVLKKKEQKPSNRLNTTIKNRKRV